MAGIDDGLVVFIAKNTDMNILTSPDGLVKRIRLMTVVICLYFFDRLVFSFDSYLLYFFCFFYSRMISINNLKKDCIFTDITLIFPLV